jgi:hypothetical protein
MSPRPATPLLKSRSLSESCPARPVVSHWFDTPPCVLRAGQPWTLGSSRLRRVPRVKKPRGPSSHRVAPPSEFHRAAPPLVDGRGTRPRPERLLSWDSAPLRRSRTGGSTLPELASLRSLRSQGFSPSQRLAPRQAVRPCFMPVTPMGFVPSELFPLEEPYRLSAAAALMTLANQPGVCCEKLGRPRETGRTPLLASGTR